MPIPAAADGGFFATSKFNHLKDMPVDREALLQKLSNWANDITHFSSKEFFMDQDKFFKDGKINNAADASLWMLMEANVLTVPLPNPTPEDPSITLRFSVGSEEKERVEEAVKRVNAAIQKPEVVTHLAKFNPQTVAQGYEIRQAGVSR